MKIWTVIYNYFAVLLMLFMMVIFYGALSRNDLEFQTIRLKYIMENATQGGFQAALDDTNLGMSYVNPGDVTISPQNTLEVFKSIFLMSYGLSLSAENFTDLDHYISSAVLATNNGYYIATQKNFNSIQLSWGLKKPYDISYNGGLDDVAYDLDDQGWVLAQENGPYVTITNGTQWSQLPPNIPVPTTSVVIQDVNTEITNDINYNIHQRDAVGQSTVNGVTKTFYTQDPANQFIYLPYVQTASGDNPITEPSLFVSITGIDFAGAQTVSSQSVAGYTVAQPRRVLGFVDNGINYYCYAGQLPSSDQVVAYFTTVQQAADAGYYPDLALLSN